MIALDSILDSILADPVGPAQAAPRAIGYVGADIPADLLLASNYFVCHLPWDADQDTPFADQWLESSFAPWARSGLEDWKAGRFVFLESVVFSRGDDSAQRLYYYVCELQRRRTISGPEPLIFDIARIRRDTSIHRSIAAVRLLADRLGIGDDQFIEGINAANSRRRLFTSIEVRRGAPASLYERISRASLFADIDDALAEANLPDGDVARRVLLAGSAPPDDRLHLAVEAAGWTVTGEANERSLTRLGPEIEPDGNDAAAAIGVHAHGMLPGERSFADRSKSLIDAPRRARATAVVLWLIEEDEAMAWDVPAQYAALQEEGIPALLMPRRRWDARDGAGEEIASFLGGLDA